MRVRALALRAMGLFMLRDGADPTQLRFVSSMVRAGGSLAAARLAHQGQGAAGHDVGVESAQDGHQRARRVAEGHIAQLYVAQQEAQLLAYASYSILQHPQPAS